MGYFVFYHVFRAVGLIPFYMVMKTLHLTNTRTLMVLISAVSVYNIIVTRSFMENTIPEELRDAAKVDGWLRRRIFLFWHRYAAVESNYGCTGAVSGSILLEFLF